MDALIDAQFSGVSIYYSRCYSYNSILDDHDDDGDTHRAYVSDQENVR